MTLMSFTQGKTTLGLGEYSDSQAVEHSSRGILGKSKFYRVLEEATWKQHMIGWVFRDFLIGQAGSGFWCKVS